MKGIYSVKRPTLLGVEEMHVFKMNDDDTGGFGVRN